MRRITLVLLMCVVSTAPAWGVTTHKKTSTLTVNGAVPATCTLTTAPFSFNIGIGYIHAPGNVIEKQTTLGVKCTRGATTQITMNTGLYGSAAGSQFGSRSMKDGSGDYLGYELCHDTACTSVWTPQGYNYLSPGDSGSVLPVWTRIKTGQAQTRLGSYTDSVMVTISF